MSDRLTEIKRLRDEDVVDMMDIEWMIKEIERLEGWIAANQISIAVGRCQYREGLAAAAKVVRECGCRCIAHPAARPCDNCDAALAIEHEIKLAKEQIDG